MAGSVDFFDVSALDLADNTVDPISDLGQKFAPSVTFDGVGAIWGALEAPGTTGYTCTFHVEELGAGPEQQLGVPVTGNLALGGGPYTETLPPYPVDLPAGVYRFMAIVKLDPPWDFVFGFYEGDVLGHQR